MGGDDLESEDEYLDQSWASKTDKRLSSVLDESADATEDRNSNTTTLSKKRGAGTTATPLSPRNDDNDSDDSNDGAPSKKQKTSTPRNLLLDAGRGIANEATNVQAVFLWTCFSHFRKMKQDAGDGDATESTIDEADKFTPSHFATAKTPTPSPTTKRTYERSLVTFLKNGAVPSLKRLKRWPHTQSPMVIVVCLSARRAVSLLKDLSSLNVRVAKLFAKHMDMADQVAMLRQNKYGIGVGTPNRLLKLVEEGALMMERTERVLVDCHEDGKRFTVCTMNDTAPDLMEFINRAVLPQIRTRKTIKFAMF